MLISNEDSAIKPTESRESFFLSRLIIAVFLCQIVIATATQTHLANDGSAFLYWLMSDPRPMTWYPARRFAHLITQLPVVVAIRCGVTNVGVLSRILGIGFYLPWIAGLFTCAWLARRRLDLLIVPLLCAVAVTESASLMIVTESHALVAVFWPLLFLLVLRERWSPLLWTIALVFAVPTLLSYQSMLFMGPILAALSVWRALQSRRAGEAVTAATFVLLAFYFCAGILVALLRTIHPRDVVDLQNFVEAVRFYRDATGRWHLLAVLSVIGIAVTALFLGTRISTRLQRILLTAFAAAAVIAVALPWIYPALISSTLELRARTMNSFLPPLLGLLVLYLVKNPPSPTRLRNAYVIVALIGLAQLGFHVAVAKQWTGYLASIRKEITARRGLIPFRESGLSMYDGDKDHAQLNTEWTLPVMSILMAPHGRVQSMIENRDPNHWQPFDPREPDRLRDLSRYGITFDAYRAALRECGAKC